MFPGETILSKPEAERKNPHYSGFQVLKSGAGWYIGTMFTACDKDKCDHGCADEYDYLTPAQRLTCQEPGSRETGYFDSEEAATAALKKYNETGVLDQERY